MWKKIILILTLQFCAELSAKSIYRGNHNEWPEQVPVNQHVYYPQQYGVELQDLSAYIQKLQEQGLIHHNSQPFVMPYNTYGYEYPSYPPYQVNYPSVEEQSHVAPEAAIPEVSNVAPVAAIPEESNVAPEATEEDKGDVHNITNIIPSPSIDSNEKQEVNDNETLSSPDLQAPVEHHNVEGKKPIISHLNVTVHKAIDSIEHKVNVVKDYVHKSVQEINKIGDDVYQQVGIKTSKIFDKINKKLEKIENQLHLARSDNLDDFIIENDDEEDNYDDMSRSLLDEEDENPVNTVDSETGKRLHNLESLDAELRTDLKNSISNAIKNSQQKFNKMIEHKVAAVNNKVERVFNKLHAILGKLKLQKTTVEHSTTQSYDTTTPLPVVAEKYTTIQWKPKETTWKRVTQNHVTTPAYFQYTIPNKDFFYNSFDSNGDDLVPQIDNNLRRMDENAEKLEQTENVDDATKSNETELKSNENVPKAIDEAQVVENLKDTLKSDNESDKSEVVDADIVDSAKSENPNENEPESNVAEELRNEMQTEDDKLSKNDDEKNIQIDNVENPDDLRNLVEELDDIDEEEPEDDEEEEQPTVYDDFVKSSTNDDNENDENDEIDDNIPQDTEIDETRSIDNEEKNFDNEEIPSDIPSVVDDEKQTE